MADLIIKLGREKIFIDKDVFVKLLQFSAITELAPYIKAIADNHISFDELKKLAVRADVPYPLFFATKEIVQKQLANKNKHLFEKIPTKDEMQLTSRGGIKIKDIELIIKDLGRKQEFLKARILPAASINTFLGSIAQDLKNGVADEELATKIRKHLDIDLQHVRSHSKEKVMAYLCDRAEAVGILISFSSYNYMPQNLQKDLTVSGICIKDKKFPYIFINTRDGDEKPKILESTGRQIFTLLSMLVCIAMKQFVLSTKIGRGKNDPSKRAFAIAGEIIIPRTDLDGIAIKNLDGLKRAAHQFRVTPSMLLYRLKEHKKVSDKLANALRLELQKELKKVEPRVKHSPLPVNGYGKYNGSRFSREVISAYHAGRITQIEVTNVLFRRGKKMDASLFNDYSAKFRPK